MKIVIALCLLVSIVSCQKKEPLLGDTDWQRQKNADFKDASKSPLKKKDLKNFKTLDFFPVDSSFIVQAVLTRTPDSTWFSMPTTTDRVSKERVYGMLSFSLQEQNFELAVYQGEETMAQEGMEDYLFLPFIDDTNGETTYGGGRYLDLRIPEGNTMLINFNEAYNPYCVYNETYSCPLVPQQNTLNVAVTAGEKNFIPAE
ncbi:DUF1684 domain-containing protein [Bizionia sediminis]|uniref:DUF1684 domain-containing protein n=1 Tax=Bizionia sediminis TaxID=1737064 RepID=A0ABW5KPH9_9FLAO